MGNLSPANFIWFANSEADQPRFCREVFALKNDVFPA